MRNSVPKKEITIAEYSSIDDSQKIRQLQLTGYDYDGRKQKTIFLLVTKERCKQKIK